MSLSKRPLPIQPLVFFLQRRRNTMPKKEKTENQKQDALFEKFKEVELTPLPYFSSELLSLPEDVAKELRKAADRHNCTVSYVISHFFEDFLSDVKELSKVTPENLIQISKEKPYLFIKKEGKPFARVSFFGEDEKWTKDYALKEKESK